MQNFSMDPLKREPFHATLKRIVAGSRGPRSIIFCRAVSAAPIKRPITRRLLPRICICDSSPIYHSQKRRLFLAIDRSIDDPRDSQVRAKMAAPPRVYFSARRLVLFARLL